MPPSAALVATDAGPPPSKLLTTHEAFVQELMRNGGHQSEAYRSVFPNCGSDECAKAAAQRLMVRPDVKARLAELTAIAAQACVIDRTVLLQEMLELATCDMTAISQIVRDPCPACWPDDEVDRAVAHWTQHGGALADIDEPRRGCRKCRGRGARTVVLTPTAELSGAARRLFQGARQRADGSIEVRTINQFDARKELAELLGMKVSRSQSVVAHVHVEPLKDMTEAELIEMIRNQRRIDGVTVEAGEPTP